MFERPLSRRNALRFLSVLPPAILMAACGASPSPSVTPQPTVTPQAPSEVAGPPASAPQLSNKIDLDGLSREFARKLDLDGFGRFVHAMFINSVGRFVYQSFVINGNRVTLANHVHEDLTAKSIPTIELMAGNRRDTYQLSDFTAMQMGYPTGEVELAENFMIGTTTYSDGGTGFSEGLWTSDAKALSAQQGEGRLVLSRQLIDPSRGYGLNRLFALADLNSTEQHVPRLQLLILDSLSPQRNFGSMRIMPPQHAAQLVQAISKQPVDSFVGQANFSCPGTSGAPIFNLLDLISASSSPDADLPVAGFVSGGSSGCSDGFFGQFVTPTVSAADLASINVKEFITR